MPRNGSGTFSRTAGGFAGSSTWQNQRDTTSNIYASNHDEHDQDVADAITASLSKDGQTTPTANLPMGTYRHTGVGNPSARDQYATVAGIMDGSYIWGGTATGSSGAFNCAMPIDFSTLVAGCEVKFLANHTPTGASTLQLDSGATTAIRSTTAAATPLVAGDIISGSLCHVVFDGTYWRLLSPQSRKWETWAPTLGAAGSMTIASTSVGLAEYLPGGGSADIRLYFTGTLGGVADTYVTATLPFSAPSETYFAMQYADIYQVGTSRFVGKVRTAAGSNIARFYKADESNYALAQHTISAHFRVRL